MTTSSKASRSSGPRVSNSLSSRSGVSKNAKERKAKGKGKATHVVISKDTTVKTGESGPANGRRVRRRNGLPVVYNKRKSKSSEALQDTASSHYVPTKRQKRPERHEGPSPRSIRRVNRLYRDESDRSSLALSGAPPEFYEQIFDSAHTPSVSSGHRRFRAELNEWHREYREDGGPTDSELLRHDERVLAHERALQRLAVRPRAVPRTPPRQNAYHLRPRRQVGSSSSSHP